MIQTSPFLLATATQRIGEKLGISPWVLIDQVQVNVFGEVTRWRTRATVTQSMVRPHHMAALCCMASMPLA